MNIGSTAGSAFTTAAAAVSQGTEQVNRAARDVVDATTERPVEGVGKTEKALTLCDPKIGSLNTYNST